MPEQQLKAQVEALRQTLNDREIQLTIRERSALEALVNNLEARLLISGTSEEGVADPSLVSGVELLIKELYERYPTTTATLRNILQTLSNMGI